MTNLAGINIQKPIIRIPHSKLERSGDSIFKSKCPECKEGILLMWRDSDFFKLEDGDMCILCGQRFIYLDIDDIGRNK